MENEAGMKGFSNALGAFTRPPLHQDSLEALGYVERRMESRRSFYRITQSGIDAVNRAEATALRPADEIKSEEPDGDAPYVPSDGDHRLDAVRPVVQRPGQGPFRAKLRQWYGDHCMVTGTKVWDVLEAAHISPHLGPDDDVPQNGLLLRADIHALFDRDLLGIEPDNFRIELHPDIAREDEYKALSGKQLHFSGKHRPSADALKWRYQQFRANINNRK